LLQEGKGVTWSIAVEFKFYFVLPVIIFISYWIKTNFGHLAEIVTLMIFVALSQMISPQSASLTNDPHLLPYLCIFLFGTALASIQCEIEAGNISIQRFRILIPLSYLAVCVLILMTPAIASLAFSQIDYNFFHKYFIQYALLWSIVLLSIINFNTPLSVFFSSKILCFYGGLSFSIYLFHPIFSSIASKIIDNSYAAAWFVLIFSTAASYVSFRLLELPASKLKISFKQTNKLD